MNIDIPVSWTVIGAVASVVSLSIVIFQISGLEVKQVVNRLTYTLSSVLGKIRYLELAPFWKPFVSDSFKFVLPVKDSSIEGTMYLDYLGSGQLLAELNRAFSNLEYDFVRDDVEREKLKSNLISVGGPITNSVSERVLSQDEAGYWFPNSENGGYKHEIELKPSQATVFRQQTNDRGEIVQDYGIITKTSNPYDDSSYIIVVSGTSGWGTKAGLELLADQESLDQLIDKVDQDQSFQILYTVGVDGSGRITEPKFLEQTHEPESGNVARLTELK